MLPREGDCENQNIIGGTGSGTPLVAFEDGTPFAPGECFEAYAIIKNIATNAHTPAEVSIKNVEHNIKLTYPRLHQLREFDEIHPTKPIYLIGGGPSVKDTIHDLLAPGNPPGTIVACGSSHDFIVSHGLVPDYCVVCDPDPISKLYLKTPNKKTHYLLSTHLHPSIVEHLRGYNIAFWHCHSDAHVGRIKELELDYQAIGGGCTVGLRALSIFITFGYKNFHFFGFDSCLDEESEVTHHAYPFECAEEELGHIYQIRIGFDGPTSKPYKVAGYHIAQARHFVDFYRDYHKYFTPTFHGTGLLPDVWNAIQRQLQEVGVEEAIETIGVQL